jgi:drug/metabolite transporter (DMT)-like permease
MFLVMEPVVGSIIGWLLGVDVIPGTWTILGGILMISGLALVTIESDSSEYSS